MSGGLIRLCLKRDIIETDSAGLRRAFPGQLIPSQPRHHLIRTQIGTGGKFSKINYRR